MSERRGDPLAGCGRLIIDGSNQRTLHDEPVAVETYASSLRRLFPPSIDVLVVFDTDPPIGQATSRRIGGVTVVHARSGGADDAIVQRVSGAPTGTCVVTDDIDLSGRVTALGARAVRNDWLQRRRQIGRSVAPSLGRRGARPPTDASGDGENERDGRPWQPGRGATVKRGPGHRPPRRRA